MKIEDIKAYCQSKNRAYEDHPFGDIPVCYKLNGKIFAQIYPLEEERKITLKCSRDAGDFYRQQPFWNTVYHDRLPDEELLNMIDHAYEQVLHSFSRKVQKELETEPSETGEEECSDLEKKKRKKN